ncbi:hypothetical protein [Chryseolinea lacunae]|uniref:Uncharacterized protein n=1 Tax=Chryseolinea lacunae TaxID=2801331 RepID=A0ABS1KKT4_9BACT|nr:hypothetical protein [Chryseolinea lacunae]MBL0739939.1 hypothetical protein [Chryseolinea lacunae]
MIVLLPKRQRAQFVLPTWCVASIDIAGREGNRDREQSFEREQAFKEGEAMVVKSKETVKTSDCRCLPEKIKQHLQSVLADNIIRLHAGRLQPQPD